MFPENTMRIEKPISLTYSEGFGQILMNSSNGVLIIRF